MDVLSLISSGLRMCRELKCHGLKVNSFKPHIPAVSDGYTL